MFYSPKDLEGLSKNLVDCRRYVERGRDQHSPHLLTLLDARIQVCEEVLAELELNLSQLTPELTPKWEKLVSLLRTLASCNARSTVLLHIYPSSVTSNPLPSSPTKKLTAITRSFRNYKRSSRSMASLRTRPLEPQKRSSQKWSTRCSSQPRTLSLPQKPRTCLEICYDGIFFG
jgi:hypothetical protein